MSFESRHQIGEEVVLSFYESGKLTNAFISGVRFTDYGKVLYDVTIYPFPSEEENKEIGTTLVAVDSYFVKPLGDESN